MPGASSGGKSSRAVQVSYRGTWKARNFILDSLRRQGPCRTFAGICRILTGTNGSGCILDALDPSNMCGKTPPTPPPGTCSPPCVNGRCEGSKCVCTAGYYGLQCQRFYGKDKLTFQIPRVLNDPSNPNHRNTAKLLVKASKGWPLVCILRANVNNLNDTLYKPVAGDSMIHPVHACPHLLTPKSRSAFRTGLLIASSGNASHQLDLHDSIDTATGKLRWTATFSDDYSFFNTTSGPLKTQATNDEAYDPNETMLSYNDTAFYDERLAALAGTTASADAGAFAAYVAMDSYLRSPSHRRASGDSDDQDQKLKALGSLTQALTTQLAAQWMRPLLLHLARLDDDHADVEAGLTKQRGENCDMLAFQIFLARKRPEVTTADVQRLSDLQLCFCDASSDTMAGCLAYADVVANDTANAYNEVSEGAPTARKIPAAGVRSAPLPVASSTGSSTSQSDEMQGSGNRRRVLSAGSSATAPAMRTAAVPAVAVAASAAAAAAVWQGGMAEPWGEQDMRMSLMAPQSDAFAPVLYSMGGRQLQQVACNFQGDKDKQTSGWISFLFSNGIGWVLNGPSISLQCCIVLPFTEQLFIACFGISVGSFNFQGFNANLMQDTASFNLQNVLGISDVYCKDRKGCEDTCGDAVTVASPAGPQGEQFVCKLDKGGAVLDEMNFNFVASFSVDFCLNTKVGGVSKIINAILTMFGLPPCFLGFSVATYPLRGWDYTVTLYAQIAFVRITISWDIATAKDLDDCDHYCHCYPGNKLFGATPYCRMCTNDKKSVMSIDISFRVLFFKFTIYNNAANLPKPKQAACPAKLRKLAASSDLRRHDMGVLNDLFAKLAQSSTNMLTYADQQLTRRPAAGVLKLGGAPMSCSGCNATDSCLISRNANQTMTSCSTLSKEDVHVWLKLSVQDCLTGDCQNCTQQTGDVAGSCAKCNQCLSCAPGVTAGNSGVSSYCGNNGTANEFNDWHTVQDWIDDLVINGADNPCPCKAAESCMLVTPTLLNGEGDPLRNGVCVNLTLIQTADLLQDGNWPGLLKGHTHDVGCSQALTLPLLLRNPPRHSWHGPTSFCAWLMGGLAFVEGANDPYQAVGLPCGPREGALTSNTSTEANLCPPVPGLVCAWDNTCSFAPKHRWAAFGCQQQYTSNAGACISTAFDNSTGLTIEEADCSTYHTNYQYYGEYTGAPPPSWSTNSSCNGQSGVLRAAEFLEARNYDGMAWRMVLQGDGRLMVYFIHLHDFFDGIQKVPLLQEATALRPAIGRQLMFSYPDLTKSPWRSNGYFRAGPAPYFVRLTHEGLFMSSSNVPAGNFLWSLTWYSIGVGPFDSAYPVSIRGTNMTTYTGWFSVCGLPASHAACTLDGQAAVAGRPACSSLEKCHPWIKLSGP
uniref:EGF-like domain-containing protein n=1 Tax=Tetradesmus obliquus TaxID=3088 RepID=A0A383W3N6_TETOB|eukprot:jgi/Sobl393_1/10215/SZX71732.1